MNAVAKKYQKRYREYRGRRRGGSVVLKVIIAVLVLVLVAFAVLMGVLGGRVEYTDEGVRLVLPWTEQAPGTTEEPVGPGNSEPPVLIVDDPDEPTPEPSPEPSPEAGPQQIGAVEVPAGAVADETAAGLVTAAGGNTLVVEMKSASGQVYWNSAEALPGAVADGNGAVTAGVQALAEKGELHLVARVVCFRDQLMVSNSLGGPLMTRGGNTWYDVYGLRWVSPASPEARDYLIRLCLELAELGFDEILLDCAGYPYFGEVHVLATDDLRPENLTVPVERFWQELKIVLAEHDTRLSVIATGEMVQGTETYSGITPDLLERYAHRVWVKAADWQGAEVEFADRLVIIGGTAEGSWADIQTSY